MQPFGTKRKGGAAAHCVCTLVFAAVFALPDAAQAQNAAPNSDPVADAADAAKNFLNKAPSKPDRDFELRIGTVFIGTSFAIYPWDHAHFEFGFAFKTGIEKGFDFAGEVIPIGHASTGIDAGLMLGFGWDQAFADNVLFEGDELSWRAGVRWRSVVFVHGSATALAWRLLTADVEAGFGTVFPVYGGATYTYWLLPSKRSGLRWLSNLVNLGVFVRAEIGPEIGSFTTYVDDVEDLQAAIDNGLEGLQPKTTFPVVRPYYNLVFGIVI